MLKQTLPLLKNFPLTRTVGPALNKVHLPHELSSSAKAEIIDSHIIDPFDFKRPPSTRQDNPTVVFGNRLRRKGFPKGTGKMAPVLCVDLFTMLDEKPLARAVKAEIGRISNDQARAFAKEWRREQLSYMFRLNAMGMSSQPSK